MTVLPALIGGILAAATGFALLRLGLLHKRGIIGLLLIAIAGFWPLFAVAAQDDGQLLFHLAIFGTFASAALFSFRLGLSVLAFALIAHGVFDLALLSHPHPGPTWWPTFCAGYDVVIGLFVLFAFLRRRPQ